MGHILTPAGQQHPHQRPHQPASERAGRNLLAGPASRKPPEQPNLDHRACLGDMVAHYYQIATVGRYRRRMGREQVEHEMTESLGGVLGSFDRIPDEFMSPEWELMKRVQLGETLIPNKYKELIGLAIAAVMRCRYGVLLHTEGARLHGATDAEVAEALHYAKLNAGWSVHLAGLQVDYAEFTREVERTMAFLAQNALEDA
jgi:AhpD family alkylhydroperoxidase